MQRPTALAFLAVLTACGSVHERLSKTLLVPPDTPTVEPAMLALQAEWFEIPAGDGSLTGWFLPAADADGRTVVVFHDRDDDVSTMHPYYRFLVAAGLNVCVFDYRGYGGSRGLPSLRSAFMESQLVVDHIAARPDVDPNRIGYYGLSFGCSVALYTALRSAPAALVLENCSSMRSLIRDDAIEQRGDVSKTLSVGFVEFAGLPDDTEAFENARRLDMPSLWINGADEAPERLRDSLQAYYEMGGRKQIWMLPATAESPHSLMTHDGEYQRAVARFLSTALAGAPEGVDVAFTPGPTATGGGTWWNVALQREGGADATQPWAVQICALDAAARPVYENAWLDGPATKVRMRMEEEPQIIGSMRLEAVERTEDSAFRRVETPLSRAGRWIEQRAAAIDMMRSGEPTLRDARLFAQELTERDAVEPLPRPAEAELADVYAAIGRILLASADAEDKVHALTWLQRAVTAAPAQPALHYWPGRPRTIGYPQMRAVEQARKALAGRAAQ